MKMAIISKFIQGLHFMETRFSLQQYVCGINSPLIIENRNHKISLKDYPLILIIIDLSLHIMLVFTC